MAAMVANNIRKWSERSLEQYWKMVGYASSLPQCRWLRRVLAWTPLGYRSQGRPSNTWQSTVASFCEENGVGDWILAAQDSQAWLAFTEDFIEYANF